MLIAESGPLIAALAFNNSFLRAEFYKAGHRTHFCSVTLSLESGIGDGTYPEELMLKENLPDFLDIRSGLPDHYAALLLSNLGNSVGELYSVDSSGIKVAWGAYSEAYTSELTILLFARLISKIASSIITKPSINPNDLRGLLETFMI